MGFAQRSVLHGVIPPHHVDQMDLVTIWALMGVAKVERDLAAAAAQYRAPVIVEGQMTPLTDEEKAARYAARSVRRTGRRGRTTAG